MTTPEQTTPVAKKRRPARLRPKKKVVRRLAVCSPRELNTQLSMLTRAQAKALAELSGVPFTTIYGRRSDRDIQLGTAFRLVRCLPFVHDLPLPERGDYARWVRTQRAKAIDLARRAMREEAV